MKFAFFGTGPLAISALEVLVSEGHKPSLIVTKPDAPVGRHQILTAPDTKIFAQDHNIPVYQPSTLKGDTYGPLHESDYDFFVVASYGKILPKNILSIPSKGVLNIHPSLLPHYRGPTPIESALLHGDDELFVSVMLLDEEMDHGPILTSSPFASILGNEDRTAEYFEHTAGKIGAELLTEYLDGKELAPKAQNHPLATFTRKFTKEDGRIVDIRDTQTLARIWRATTPWPGAYFEHVHNGNIIRVKIKSILFENNSYKIDRVVPEGKKEMSYADFLRGYTQK